jgi:antitoxin FitA
VLSSLIVPAIRIRDVPPDVHERLRLRAEAERVSLDAYVLRLIERDVSRPSTGEWLASLGQREPVQGVDVTATVREVRQAIEQRPVGALRH